MFLDFAYESKTTARISVGNKDAEMKGMKTSDSVTNTNEGSSQGLLFIYSAEVSYASHFFELVGPNAGIVPVTAWKINVTIIPLCQKKNSNNNYEQKYSCFKVK